MHKLLVRNNGVNKGTFYETEGDSQTENRRGGPGERHGEGGREFGVSRRELLYIRMDKHKVLLHNTGNYSQNPAISHTEKNMRKNVSMYN